MKRHTWLIGMVICLLSISITAKEFYGIVNINNIGSKKLSTLKNTAGVKWWVEIDSALLVLAPEKVLDAINNCKKLTQIKTHPERLYFIRRAHESDLKHLNAEVLARGGRYAVVQARNAEELTIEEHFDPGHAQVHASVQPFKANSVLARQGANEPATIKAFNFDPSVKEIVDRIDGARWLSTVEKLASINRYTHGNSILTARDWLVEQYKALPGFEVRTMEFRVGSTTAYNVIATLKGTERPNDWYIIGGHYDSISQDPRRAAPGAEDNASGAAGTLEMARVFAQSPPKATLIFISFSGEEQGLHGSTKHVNDVIAKGEKNKIKAVLNMDMIGYTDDNDLDCLLETGSVGKHLFEVFENAAKEYTSLRIIKSLNPFGSDHVPYIRKGIAALLTITNDWDSYGPYHTTNDVALNVSVEQGSQTLKMNVATMAHLANK